MAMASTSVLKLVSTIQKIGKNSNRATPQAVKVTSTVEMRLRCILHLQLSGDGADEEDRNDVAQHDRHHPACGTAAYIELQQRPGVDQEGEVGRRIARTAR